MVKTYLEDIDFLLTPEKQVRFNQETKSFVFGYGL